MSKKYYAVKKGKACGIFMSWAECEKQVKGVSNAEYRGFNSIAEAESYLKGNKKKGFYAVRKGRRQGIFTTWEECKAQVNGYSNAEYRGFKTIKEAERYLLDANIKVKPQNEAKTKAKTKAKEKAKANTKAKKSQKAKETKSEKNLTASDIEDLQIDESFLDLSSASAYVDGSYFNGVYAGAALILYQGQEIPIAKAYRDKQSKLKNVAGEIMGVVLAIEYCKKHNIKNLYIYHDYNGLSEWGNGKWKTNLPLTKRYKEFINEVRNSGMNIVFRKVKAHSGIEYNEVADALAKDALRNPSKYKNK